jgi:hypothetical protein
MPIVDIRGAKELLRDLKNLRQKGVPFALRNALTTAAQEARSAWQGELRKTFTLRNQYTTRSILVVAATTKTLVARVGSTADYLAGQEVGKRVGRKATPAPSAAGQAPGGKRTAVVRGRNAINKVAVDHPSGIRGNRVQRNAVRMSVARRAGHKFVLLERPGGKGKALFALSGGRRRIALRMLWAVGRGATTMHAAPTLQRALDAVTPKLDSILKAATLAELNRFNIPHT